MPSEETICTVCELPVGLMTPYRGPGSFRATRKAILHANPKLPKVNGRAQRCAGSCLEVPAVAIYEVEGNAQDRRRRRERALR